MRHLVYSLLLIVLFISSDRVLATAPLPARKSHTLESPNRHYMAELNATTNSTTLYKLLPNQQRKELWRKPYWSRWASISNMGYVAFPYKEASLLLNPNPALEMLRIISPAGKTVITLTLQQLISNLKTLRKTVSHYYWGTYKGFDSTNCFVIDTVENKRFTINPETGQINQIKLK